MDRVRVAQGGSLSTLHRVESDDESCGWGAGSESESVSCEVNDGVESLSMLSAGSNNIKLKGKSKKKSN